MTPENAITLTADLETTAYLQIPATGSEPPYDRRRLAAIGSTGPIVEAIHYADDLDDDGTFSLTVRFPNRRAESEPAEVTFELDDDTAAKLGAFLVSRALLSGQAHAANA